jgi:hypothetical protein
VGGADLSRPRIKKAVNSGLTPALHEDCSPHHVFLTYFAGHVGHQATLSFLPTSQYDRASTSTAADYLIQSKRALNLFTINDHHGTQMLRASSYKTVFSYNVIDAFFLLAAYHRTAPNWVLGVLLTNPSRLRDAPPSLLFSIARLLTSYTSR